ncbi:peptide/nickel transport system substrate-binding protein [Frankineae bacterium MT45]|nr:peptide/nickel transport system substrate-binding protein [Frankineae bacterium MT45]
MATNRKRTAILAVGVSLALTVSACSSSKSSSSSSGSSATSAKTGGTVYYLTKRNVEHWDPQRMYIGRDLTDASRLFYRTLTMLDPNNKVVPDLATDTGQASNSNKTWKFTLKDGVKWQDGTPITCEDIKYGVSRTFATDVITGGPNYAIQFLDIPTNADGSSIYSGPYTKKNQAAYDKAVTCTGNTITFNLKKSVGDFNYAVSGALAAFGPYKESQDKGAKSNYSIFSDGPYELQGTWTEGKGGTFVRNPNYDPKTDNTSIRKALPDKFVWEEGIAVETVFDRLLADQGPDKFAVTDRSAPPAYASRVVAQKSRMTNPNTPFVDYLLPNFKKLTNPLVRQALAVAVDKTSWITAYGGSELASPANSIILPGVDGYKQFDNVFGAPDSGDAAKAKELLTQAGVKMPYPIHFTYSGGTPTTDAQASSLKAALDKAGFTVTLEGLSDTYYDVIQNPSNASKYDLTWAGWGADWPNASTVIPPLFDSRVNLSAASNGQDYGYYQSDATNAAIDAAYAEQDAAKRNADWGDLSESLAKETAYIGLDIEKFLRLHGSGVTNYIEDNASNGYPDLGMVGAAS